MQQALSAGPTAPAAVGTESSSRKNKIVAASVAALGASAIAITPVASSPALIEAQQRAVQLAAATDATSSPLDAYGQLFDNTASNITNLADSWALFPALGQIGDNQSGYLQTIANMANTVPASFEAFWNRHEVDADGNVTKKGGADYLNDFQTALQGNDIGAAYDALNNLVLRGSDNLLMKPVFSVLLSNSNNVGVPEQMALDFAAVVGVLANSDTLFKGGFQSLYAPLSGVLFQLSRAAGDVSSSTEDGDPTTALSSLVDLPAVLADTFLNGFDYNDGDTIAPWAGLLSSRGSCTGSCTPDGPIAAFFQTIPKKIADAIAPEAEAEAATTNNTTALAGLSGLFGQTNKSVTVNVQQLSAEEESTASADKASDEAKGSDDGDKSEKTGLRAVKQERRSTWGTHSVKVTPAADTEKADSTKADDTAKPAANNTTSNSSWQNRFKNRSTTNNSAKNETKSNSADADSSNTESSKNKGGDDKSTHKSSSKKSSPKHAKN
ncbi:hypothetical protein [Mycobacterium sp. 155]|uniref:hypothetical protein n=1 Tax=Mycobacterium sp. 155 TaxID=1157943 RepID=UPI00036286B8|nr:hypothetical protein [Mycobacterium sp. 155]